MYINKKSNHLPSVLQQLPKSVWKRISEISSNESTPCYENALKRADITSPKNICQHKIKNENNQQREQRKQKIIWFNPSYSLSVKTNVGKFLLKLLNCHFPRARKFHKIFSSNTVKVSYCCMKNIGSLRSAQNKQVLQPRNENFGCNCKIEKERKLFVRQ